MHPSQTAFPFDLSVMVLVREMALFQQALPAGESSDQHAGKGVVVVRSSRRSGFRPVDG
jgi:hypothetical protein